ncbi:MAG: hypothetical protein KGI58_02540 [Patescibacteria group bacterium]|nr:hypothetical protein [Patescibacteria group bacterium]
MNTYLFYILNILLIALPLAIFEIIIEKDHGWGSGWSKDKWYAKPFHSKSLFIRSIIKILNIESPLYYHVLVFWVVLPIIFITEFFWLESNILLLISSYIAVMIFEDFFWFLLNWNFDSLRQLCNGPKGSIWWHKRWRKIYKNYYLPASYFPTLLLSIILLILSSVY